ncbi:MAG: adenosylcobalamin-dependent ribonucleoside-diphosphate reductase [Candidatus Diapherotrites archaeon]|uniref:Vitamin B12-dependent ribonucleotide reductase n=1 Tax=Candidatus Iainarchaeum sp. TaxID=3101447 RepID=A0A8T4C770_9ARCH|nr:adenosylcobalamin-dependent ribonucleoside-diphosphate reductase [Candidatus Diapherotrites archaeon]
MNETQLQTAIPNIKKRNGAIVPFNQDKVTTAISKAIHAVGKHDESTVLKISDKVIERILNERQTSPENSIPTVEHIQDVVEEELMRAGETQAAKAFILYRQKRTEERELKHTMLGMSVDTKVGINQLRVLKERYLLKDENGKVKETPEQLWRRVANNIAQAELLHGGTEENVQFWSDKFFTLMENMEYMPNTPTLMNAGTKIQQLSACFVLPVEDSIEGIYDTMKHQALIHQSGGGTGFSFSRLRPKGSMVKSTSGVATGPVGFMSVYNASTEIIKQGGKRRGANMGILRVDHPDIREFIHCKDDITKINNFNISVALTEKFMEAVENDEEFDLINPHNKTVARRENARMLFDELVTSAWKSGDPGIVFIDRINRDNTVPHIYEIEATNPCGEQPLGPYDSCNLGSINLAKYITNEGEVDWARLRETVRTTTRFLDNTIDMNRYVIPQIEKMNKGNRRIGLGVMGWADMLFKLGIPYNSEEGCAFAEKMAKFVRDEADAMSQELGREKGTFPHIKGSVYDVPNGPTFRNCARITIAPTGTISMIADCSSGIEPLFAISFVKRVMDGQELLYVNEIFKEAAIKRGFYSEELMEKIAREGTAAHCEEIPEDIRQTFVCAHDISPYWHVRMQAAWQKYTDNAISKTVNFPHTASVEEVREVYTLAYKQGCKGVTIYRDGSKGFENQVLNLNVEGKSNKQVEDDYKAKVMQATKHDSRQGETKKCTKCGGNKLHMQEGCATCMDCGYSYCSV